MWSEPDATANLTIDGADVTPVSPLVYRPAPGWVSQQPAESPAGTLFNPAGNGGADGAAAANEEVLKAREKQAWEKGVQAGVEREKNESQAALQQHREAIGAALREFATDRANYFHRVEAEVVALSLAIVRKILRRESQVDPLLLTGLVHVALEKMAGSQTLRLRAHPSRISVWREYFAHKSDTPIPELSGDDALGHHECQIETELGTTEVNLEMPLKEIEQGLFDLLAQRPAAR